MATNATAALVEQLRVDDAIRSFEQVVSTRECGTATIAEFARRYGIGRSTAYALAKRDALPIPTIRLGRRLVVSRALMERVLAGEMGSSPTSERDAA